MALSFGIQRWDSLNGAEIRCTVLDFSVQCWISAGLLDIMYRYIRYSER